MALENYTIEQNQLNLMLVELSCPLIENTHTEFEKTINYSSLIKLNQFLLKLLCLKELNNIIFGCIYRHSDNDTDDFNTIYLRLLLQKLPKELSKNIFLLGDFNIVLLKFNSCNSVCNFLVNSLIKLFHVPDFSSTRITRSTKTLIDDICCNIPQPSEENISVNLTTTYSDNLLQILLVLGCYRYKNLPK